ncbi:MAG: hypothetical protein IT281_06745 [Ignavibacteria bacterium]|nr:hypothetical protein [Ignavibacteria bacterium]
MEDSKKIKIEKVIFVGYLAEGNFRIEDMNLHKEFQGLYYYQVDVLDSVHYERVFLMK